MSVHVGRDAKITFGATTISEMADFSFALEAPLLGEPVFGNDGWDTVAGAGNKSAKGSMSGLTDTADTDGQVALETAVISGTKITDLRLYINDTDYWTSNTGADADAGVYFSNLSTTVSPNEIVKFSVDYQFTGQVHRTS